MVAAWSTVVYGFSLSAIAGLDHDVALEQSRESDLELFQWKPVVTVIGQHLCGRYFFLPLGVGQISSSSGNPGSIGTYLDRQSL